ncbi:hypothetical protein T439DRAFT_98465 [Meredithblackwellia eburnea MCA 4105]
MQHNNTNNKQYSSQYTSTFHHQQYIPQLSPDAPPPPLHHHPGYPQFHESPYDGNNSIHFSDYHYNTSSIPSSSASLPQQSSSRNYNYVQQSPHHSLPSASATPQYPTYPSQQQQHYYQQDLAPPPPPPSHLHDPARQLHQQPPTASFPPHLPPGTGDARPPPARSSSFNSSTSLTWTPEDLSHQSVAAIRKKASVESRMSSRGGPGDEDDSRTTAPLMKGFTSRDQGRNQGTNFRKSNSCGPCKRRKMKCDRCSPCSACVSRKEGHLCTWKDATPLYSLRSDNDVKELKDQVERLQDLLNMISERSTIPIGHLPSAPPSTLPDSPVSASTSQGSFAKAKAKEAKEEEEENFDVRANDLANALSELALTGLSVLDSTKSGTSTFTPSGESGDLFIKDAQRFLESVPAGLGINLEPPSITPDLPTPTFSHFPEPRKFPSASTLIAGPPPLEVIIGLLPTEKEADMAIKFWRAFLDWFYHPCHGPTFDRQREELNAALALPPEEREKKLDKGFLATYLAMCVSGMVHYRWPDVPEDRASLVDKWTQACMLTLTAAGFVSEPSIETVRAAMMLVTMNIFWGTGENTATCLGLLSIAIEGAFTLRLHRDPERTKGLTFVEKEDRRRLFWNLFSQAMMVSWMVGRTWSHFDLEKIDCKYPLDCHDDELYLGEKEATKLSEARAKRHLTEEDFDYTALTALLIKTKIAVVMKKCCDAVFAVRTVPYSKVLELNKELDEIEASFPLAYQFPVNEKGDIAATSFAIGVPVSERHGGMLHIALASVYVRLHRPWLVLGAIDDRFAFSRRQAVKYSKWLLVFHTVPPMHLPLGVHNYRTITCATVLSIELLQRPLEDAENERLHELVLRSVKATAPFAELSSVCRKGVKLLQFLVARYEERLVRSGAPPSSKRVRHEESPRRLKPTTMLSTSLSWTPPASVIDTPDEETRRRKGPMGVFDDKDSDSEDTSPKRPVISRRRIPVATSGYWDRELAAPFSWPHRIPFTLVDGGGISLSLSHSSSTASNSTAASPALWPGETFFEAGFVNDQLDLIKQLNHWQDSSSPEEERSISESPSASF